ncbi:MAG: hypothetical protein JOZ57_03645, partial [Abitibacteriaceae bacterium]|nr:hypothetical protein [Abditibacteriaceae bacterium]
IFMAKDGHGNKYRAHLDKRMLAVNKAPIHKKFHIEDDWMWDHQNAINMYPIQVAREYTLRKAFYEAGWLALSASYGYEVSNADCTEITLQDYLKDDELTATSNASFNNRKPGNITYCQQNRFVHVIYASHHAPLMADVAGLTSIYDNTLPVRYSYIFSNDIGPTATTDILRTTIHELGHQFGIIGDYATQHEHTIPAHGPEQDAINSNSPSKLWEWRVATVKHPTNISQFKTCVMEQSLSDMQGERFCPYHRNQIRNYTGW